MKHNRNGVAPSAVGLPPRADEIGKKGKGNMTQETKIAIFEEYQNRANKVGDIADKYGILRADVARIAVEQGATPRRPNKYGHKLNGQHIITCPNCRKRIDVKGARYCCFCGGDIRSPQDILTEKIEKVITYVSYLPANVRDETRDTLLAAIKEIRGKK